MTAGWSRNRLKFALAGPLFEAGNRFIPGRPHDRLAQLVADQHPRRVLELCGGTGYAARLLADKSPATRVDSLDISPEMLAVGCRRLTRAGIGTVVLHHGDAAALPFGDSTFDVVMSVFGWHELPTETRHRALDETRRVLRPGGQVIAVDLDPPPTARAVFDRYMRFAERPHARDVLGTGLADAFTAHGLTVTSGQPARSWARPFQIVHAQKGAY
ncbi:MAG TPA: class I SAM-dependent methyltransferase [Mycobacterium sp.]|jgi:demethylmenaquinone methyltransferase/2-methoxy-6-polyprenyl-1,4-benzoquinol methylase|uniref:class I SAM-dependent methyltransferase n=1 Tax=Mycobacteriaceae TaxID=1762 RepID=UPI0007FC49A8|nr:MULTISPECIES: class I SAM-dependent methyltransferase [Mycobacteriaceae]MCB0934775.1 class I SAM-dependent methyltransferase [Mycobacterium sp.]TXH13604.1 MAG: methyltransferase domain-containing protein [Gammaproteobacteria bacterium]MCB1286661.1 class I SAM-dependent methyltransferase [Mycobacterium sp.]OBB41748.1 methylase [Mycobacterium sp. 852002-51961_SCH5331710]HRD11247.1 class I SAM-dependent methyltransferase [Mycobacterium sp.]